MYIVSYDMSSDRLRQKMSKELENYGKRVQYSVFECRITEKQMNTLYQKMVRIMQEEPTGNVRIYNLCKNCEEKVRTIGIKEEEPSDDDIIII